LAENEVLTYLQMISPGELRPAPVPTVPFEIIELGRYSPLIRSTTLGIGQAHDWPSQSWGEEQWQAYLDRPDLRHWVAVLDGEPVGLLSLDVPGGGDVEIDTFGLLPSHLGRGLGGHFLTLSVQLAWDVAPPGARVWLHTSDRDHPAALPNYQRRGFQQYQVAPDPETASPVP
jgi:GNAT superfamily N-acetyltransferase